MSNESIIVFGRQVSGGRESLSATATLPSLIVKAGERARRRFVEFFTAKIRNPNTRRAYARAVGDFCRWCEAKRLAPETLNPVIVATYICEAKTEKKATPLFRTLDRC